MEFGIALATSTQSWKAVKRAEELGFSHAWFYDTQLLNPDVFIGMTQAAMMTQRIRLGTGVLIPSNRIEPVTANALATLNKIAPGRIDFGVGTGFTGRRTMGLGAIPLRRLEVYVERVQALLRGETIRWDFEGETRAIRFLNPDFGLINITDPIPLHISAFGPRARALTAKLGAGWINFGADVQRAEKELDAMRGVWREAGRSDGPYSTQFALGCVLGKRRTSGFTSRDRASGAAGRGVVPQSRRNDVARFDGRRVAGAGERRARTLSKDLQVLSARGRALSAEPSWPSDVHQARRTSAAERAADRSILVHRHRGCSARSTAHARRRGLFAVHDPDRRRPGRCARRLVGLCSSAFSELLVATCRSNASTRRSHAR